MNRLLAVRIAVHVREILCSLKLAVASFPPQRGRERGGVAPTASGLARGLPLVLVIVLAVAAGHRPAHAAGPVTVSVSPATATAGVGTDVTLNINAANVLQPGLGGYVILLKWDPAVLSMTSLVDGGWVTTGQILVLCTTPIINNTGINAGTAELDCTPIFGFGTGVTGSGVLAQAVFHAVAPGSTTIDVAGSSLLDPSNIVIQSTLANGSVTVPIPPTPVPGSVGGIAEEIDQRALPPQMASAGAGQGRSVVAISLVLAGSLAAAGAAAHRVRTSRR
jgi:hypothetical protein